MTYPRRVAILGAMVGRIARVSAVLVGVVAAGASSTSPEEKAAAKAKREAEQHEVATGAATDVTAGQIHADYKANEIGGDQKYRGKVLRVTGIVAQVGKSALDEPTVRLVAGRESIAAIFATDAGLGELKRSDTITARCRGERDFGNPRLVDCVLVRGDAGSSRSGARK